MLSKLNLYTFILKTIQIISEAAFIVRKNGLLQGLKFIYPHIYSSVEVLVFEKHIDNELVKMPDFLRIIKIDADSRREYESDLIRSQLDSDIRFFDRGATCFMAYLGGWPVAVGWAFRNGNLLHCLGYPKNAVYLGGFFVKKAARGQGIYPLMSRYICSTIPTSASVALAETSCDNFAAKRGLVKTGFVKKGRYRVVLIAGIPFYYLQGVESKT